MEISTRAISTPGGLVTFRSAASEDEPFLLKVYASTRADEIALTNWAPDQIDAFIKMQFAAQQLDYRTRHPQGEYLIILIDARPVGRLYVSENEDEIRILDITILPGHRSAGIGTSIIETLTREARQAGKPLTIYVESYNPSMRLFERLGFVRSGESGYSYLMKWPAR
jgi:GNAT superfamily N-acetyltransferase